MPQAPKKSLLSRMLPAFPGDRARIEKARLEAFLDAVPGEYCGFSGDGSVVYSAGFCALLGLSEIRNIHDIQNRLHPSDAAALEGFFARLEDGGKPFSFTARVEGEDRLLHLHGRAGAALDGEDRFDVLWAEDVTDKEVTAERARRAQERAEMDARRFESAIDTLPVPLWICGAGGDIVWCNRAYAALFDATPAGVVVQQNRLSILVPDQGREDSGTEKKSRVIVGGQRRIMTLSNLPLPAGESVGAARDITREDDLEREAARNLSAHKGLMEQLRTAIAIFAPDQSLEFSNTAFSQLWGFEEKWLNDRPRLGDILEKLREDRRLPEQADFRKYKQGWLEMFTRLIDPYEDMLHLPDGSALRLMVLPHPMGGLMMTFEDVTSRLELESSYNTLIAVQRETLDNLSESVAVYGGDGRIKLWNPSFAALWSFNPEELDGSPHITRMVDRMAGFFPDGRREEYRAKLIAQALERTECKGRMERKDGILLDYATIPLPDGGVLVSSFDVTDSSRVETALRDRNAALEAAENLKTDFLANVSYQLRTPLNAMMGFAEILDHQYFGPLTPRQREYTGGILEAGERFVSLIDDILDLATIEAGYLELRKARFGIAPMLQGLFALTQDWARKNNLQAHLSCPDDLGEIFADERRIKQALLNLIRNAIAFTPRGGSVSLSVLRVEGGMELCVSDTGIGIPESDRIRVFEPFERVQQTPGVDRKPDKSMERGAGLGLALVRSIVALHGGEVTLESAEGEGTSVRIRIPDSVS